MHCGLRDCFVISVQTIMVGWAGDQMVIIRS